MNNNNSNNNPKIVGIIHSKHRNAIGLVGIEVNITEKLIYVKLAKQWNRTQLNQIPNEIGKLYKKLGWNYTYIDLQTGQHFIQDIQNQRIKVNVITTQKNVKDTYEIDQARIMDKIEMVQFMVSLKQNHQVKYISKPNDDMKEMEKQISLFTEKKTEAGGIDYFAPGNELDSLTKALLIACFAARKYLGGNNTRNILDMDTELVYEENNFRI